MIRRSGASPAVKRSKLACVIWRRAASGHIEATQFGKFAAACRIALAVIRGWPEAPSSPVQGSGVDGAGGAPSGAGAACACGEGGDFCPEKILPKKFDTPLPLDDWASTSPGHSNAAATINALARWIIAVLVKRMCLRPRRPVSERPRHVSNSLTK